MLFRSVPLVLAALCTLVLVCGPLRSALGLGAGERPHGATRQHPSSADEALRRDLIQRIEAALKDAADADDTAMQRFAANLTAAGPHFTRAVTAVDATVDGMAGMGFCMALTRMMVMDKLRGTETSPGRLAPPAMVLRDGRRPPPLLVEGRGRR